MSTELLLSLVGLALLDSTSIGTLVIPLWLLLAPGPVRVRRPLLYLATIAGFYFAVGVVLSSGADVLAGPLGRVLDTSVVLYAQLLLGVGLFAWSFRFDPKRQGGDSSARLRRWRERVTPGEAPVRWLVVLALTAAVMEVATMLPYLAAVGLLSTSEVKWPDVAVLLAGYCVVMVLPALVLLVGRVAAAARIRPILERLNGWFRRHGTSATGWMLAVAGFLLARDAVARLWFA
jgi:hypothetical protein